MSFHDHFSANASGYAQFRPTYPDALFAWLAAHSPAHTLAWDCATGNGQAARALAPHFRSIVATDASAAQIAAATPCPGVDFRVAPAEASGLATGEAALVTVAQALHWFDLERFYAEVRRVLMPGGLLAVWCYETLSLGPALDAVLNHFYRDQLGPYWPPERRHIENGYAELPFPFARLETPAFTMHADWRLADLVGYLGTWSAVKRYRDAGHADPLPELTRALAPHWGEAEAARAITWPLYLQVGRV